MCNFASGVDAIAKDIFFEIAPLSCYVAFVYLSFCDGFHLKPLRKIVWGVYFLAFSSLSFIAYGRFDLRVIILLSSALAFVLIVFQRNENKLKTSK